MKTLVKFGCAVVGAAFAFSASAAEVTVSSVAELRAAIANTTDVPHGSVITLAASPTPYDVSADGKGPIKITRSLTLKGATANPRDTVLSGGGVHVRYEGGADAPDIGAFENYSRGAVIILK